jgi:hypothetical protein
MDADSVRGSPSTRAATARPSAATVRIVDFAYRAKTLRVPTGAHVMWHNVARAYRDVKAGSFMHPLGANRAYDYLGHIALAEASALH